MPTTLFPTEVHSASKNTLPSWWVEVRATWRGLVARFGLIAGLIVLFNVAGLLVQLAFFGTFAFSVFLDNVTSGVGVNAFEGLSALLTLSRASMVVAIAVMALSLLLQVWYQSSLVCAIALNPSGKRKIWAAVKQGLRIYPKILGMLVGLFLTIALVYFILVLMASFVQRYTGAWGPAGLSWMNRVLLSVFTLTMLVSAALFGFANFAVVEGERSLMAALKGSFALFRKFFWDILWRTVVFALMLYVLNAIFDAARVPQIPFHWQAIVALFYIPLSLLFLFELYKDFTKIIPHP
ncbi:MAG: hypothetical protein AB1352_01055 [Patescibacteria group bacterium]